MVEHVYLWAIIALSGASCLITIRLWGVIEQNKRHHDLVLGMISNQLKGYERASNEQTAKLITSFELGMQDALKQIEQMKQRAETAEATLAKASSRKPIPWEEAEKMLAGRY